MPNRPTFKEADSIDHRILKLLQENARLSMTELAERVGLSATPVTERVRRLERDGYISGYHAASTPPAWATACWCSWKSNCIPNPAIFLKNSAAKC